MNNKMILSSLSMDLKRVALGYHRGSNKMAERFFEEALKRRDEMNMKNLKPYIQKLLGELPKIKSQRENLDIAEDALMYSILFQNASLK